MWGICKWIPFEFLPATEVWEVWDLEEVGVTLIKWILFPLDLEVFLPGTGNTRCGRCGIWKRVLP